ncbi:MAG: NAD(P)/FAD-dependent oxidoreductase [Methylacidiphilales bacterium]|nr:NAD(P)/FAD-dependent oxidoreductase [Candidatus Methylacidiphilales bacterium]
MNQIKTDCLILGAGPTGLFQVFELGLAGIQSVIIDSLPMVGGQCSYLYPEKPIYDIPACPSILAQELIVNLMAQIKPFDCQIFLKNTAQSLSQLPNGNYLIQTQENAIETKTLVCATGLGAFAPRKIKINGIDKYENINLFYALRDTASLRDKTVCICGGGDSALDWAINLQSLGIKTHLIHRRNEFRGAHASVTTLNALVLEKKISLTIGTIESFTGDQKLHSLIVNNTEIKADVFLVFYGLLPKLGPVENFGLTMQKNQICVRVDTFETNRIGVYAVGDCNTYPGKRKLILSGFHESALCAHAIEKYLYPDRKQFNQYTTTSSQLHQRLKLPN